MRGRRHAGRTADRFRFRTASLAAAAVVLEGLILSSVEPILPGTDGTVPGIYQHVTGPLLELPGPLVRPPGRPNPSRKRLRYLTYFQTSHHQPSPWLLDVNGLTDAGPEELAFLRAWDPHGRLAATAVPADLVSRLRARGIENVMIQTAVMGADLADPLLAGLRGQGADQVANDGQRVLLRLRSAAQ